MTCPLMKNKIHTTRREESNLYIHQWYWPLPHRPRDTDENKTNEMNWEFMKLYFWCERARVAARVFYFRSTRATPFNYIFQYFVGIEQYNVVATVWIFIVKFSLSMLCATATTDDDDDKTAMVQHSLFACVCRTQHSKPPKMFSQSIYKI